MKPNYYIVTFQNGKTVFVTAFNKTDALILAQATMIKNGLTRELESIMSNMNPSDMPDTDFIS